MRQLVLAGAAAHTHGPQPMALGTCRVYLHALQQHMLSVFHQAVCEELVCAGTGLMPESLTERLTRWPLQDLFNGNKASLLDEYEYAMHGKVYKLDKKVEDGATQAVVFVSYGGLLMQLTADANKLNQFEIDSMVFLLVRKAQ